MNYKFGKYLKEKIGDPPGDMIDPLALHILFKKGLGAAQQELVEEGQLLKRFNIDPIWGLENLTWAPNRVIGQHGPEALQNVVNKLKQVQKEGGGYDDIVEMLKKLGDLAARRT